MLIAFSVIACGADGPSLAASPTPSSAVVTPTAAPTAAPVPTPSPEPIATPVPRPTATPTPDPTSSDDPRLLYAEFLLRLADARPEAQSLNQDLLAAAEARDPDAVRRAAVDILDFTDDERTWLRSHPPADCYSDTHASAGRMIDAYAATAEDAIDWADAGGGLAGLEALAAVVESAAVAGEALEDLAADLETTRCSG